LFEVDILLTLWTAGVMLALVAIVVAVGVLLWRSMTRRRGDFQEPDPTDPQ